MHYLVIELILNIPHKMVVMNPDRLVNKMVSTSVANVRQSICKRVPGLNANMSIKTRYIWALRLAGEQLVLFRHGPLYNFSRSRFLAAVSCQEKRQENH